MSYGDTYYVCDKTGLLLRLDNFRHDTDADGNYTHLWVLYEVSTGREFIHAPEIVKKTMRKLEPLEVLARVSM